MRTDHVNTTPTLSITVYIMSILLFVFFSDFLATFALLPIFVNVHRLCKRYPNIVNNSLHLVCSFFSFFLDFLAILICHIWQFLVFILVTGFQCHSVLVNSGDCSSEITRISKFCGRSEIFAGKFHWNGTGICRNDRNPAGICGASLRPQSTVPTQYRRAYASMFWTLQSPICNRLLVIQIWDILHDQKSWFIFMFYIYIGHIEKTFFLFSENQEKWMESLEKIGKVFIVLRGCVQGSGFRPNHRKCFKKSKKMAKILGKYVLKKRNGTHHCYGLLRAQSILLIIQKQDKWPESQK